jgi:hypothetical protein
LAVLEAAVFTAFRTGAFLPAFDTMTISVSQARAGILLLTSNVRLRALEREKQICFDPAKKRDAC